MLFGTILAAQQWAERDVILSQETDQLQTQNHVAALLLRTQIQTTNVALDTLRQTLGTWLSNPDRGKQIANTHLRSFVGILPAVRTISVVDENGVILLSSREQIVGGTFSQRPYFQAVLQTKNFKTVYVSEPYRAATGAWAVNVSRALFDEDATFRGVVVATLAPEYFLELMQQLGYADDVIISLTHEKGIMYLSSDQTAGRLQSELDGVPRELFSTHLTSGRRWSVDTDAPSASDSTRLIQVASTVDLKELGADNNFVAIASRSRFSVLEEWQREAPIVAGVFSLLMVGSGVALAAYQRWALHVRLQVRQASEQLVQMAYHDPLTGAFNRRAFLSALESEFVRVRRYGAPCCLLMLDIDHFKAVNDEHGHDFGDLVLKHLVTELQARLRTVDMLGRLGGEEFAILLPNTVPQAAAQLAERLRSAIESSPVTLNQTKTTDQSAGVATSKVITISIGLTQLRPEDSAETINSALKRVDEAMYAAKQTGRNRVCSA